MSSKYKYVYSIMLLILVLTPIFSLSAMMITVSMNNSFSDLEDMGIKGPYLTNIDPNLQLKPISLHIGNLKKVPTLNAISGTLNNEFYAISFDNFTGFSGDPGTPAIPRKAYRYVIDGYVRKDDIKIGVVSADYEVIRLDKPLMPMPAPVPLKGKPKPVKINETVYSMDSYIPGEIVDYYIGYGFGNKTVIIVWIYPVQYNPVEGKIIFIKDVNVVIAYPRPIAKAKAEEPLLAIITLDDLIDYVKPLAQFYTNVGLDVQIVSVEYIDYYYPPAQPGGLMTMLYGIYRYPQSLAQYDIVYQLLMYNYDVYRALRIISYLKDESAHPNLQYVLIVGNAKDIPPSFYYFDILELAWAQDPRYVDWFNAWNPTDFFYASPDYDLVPNYLVGRIPFSDPGNVTHVVNKILKWYQETANNPPWARRLVWFAGYLFQSPAMVGEAEIATLSLEGSTRMFNTQVYSRIEGTYTPANVKNEFAKGESILLFVSAHGGINSWSAYKCGYGWETLATSSDLLKLPENYKLPVVLSYACMNGLWDEAIIPPEQVSYWGPAPSIGEAILMSKGAGIAYLGHARTALATPIVVIDKGGTYIYYPIGGADLLHMCFIRTYNSLMGRSSKAPLGLVFYLGMVKFLETSLQYQHSMFLYVTLRTCLQAVLLGDPVLLLPVYDGPANNYVISSAQAVNYDKEYPGALIPQSMGIMGNVPFYDIEEKGTIRVSGSGQEAKAYVTRLLYYAPFTISHAMWRESLRNIIVAKTLKAPFMGGSATINIGFDKHASGLMLVKVVVGDKEALVYISAAGIKLEPKEVMVDEKVHIEGYGLELLTLVPMFMAYSPYVEYGITTPEELSPFIKILCSGNVIAETITDPITHGAISLDFTVSYLKPGEYVISILPQWGYLPLTEDLMSYIAKKLVVKAIKELSVEVNIGKFYSSSEKCTATAVVKLDGILTSCNVEAYLIDESGTSTKLTVNEVSKGIYIITFTAPSNEGTYTILVTASYEGKFVKAYGHSIDTFIVREVAAGDVGKVIGEVRQAKSEIIDKISSTETNVMSAIDMLNTRINEITPLLNQLAILLNQLNARITSIEGGIALIQTSIGNMTLKINDLILRITNLDNRIININTLLGDLKGRIIGIYNEVVKIDTVKGEIIMKISDLLKKMKDTESFLNSIDAKITKVSDNVVEVSTTLGTIKTDIESIITDIKVLKDGTAKIETIVGDIEGKVSDIKENTIKIITKFGELSIMLSKIEETSNTALTEGKEAKDKASTASMIAYAAVALALVSMGIGFMKRKQ